jgi:predicted N-acetyltransferase YhbS
VHPDWTRKGLGGLLLKTCEDAARAAGFRKAEMGSTLSGVPFYGKMGYVEIGDELKKVPVGEPGEGEVLELVKMGRELD